MTTGLHEDRPEHMIIWLDSHIGQCGEYEGLKRAFASNTDPTCSIPVRLNDTDLNLFLIEKDPIPVHFEYGVALLALFTDVEECIKFIEQNQDKRIFFITSGSLARAVVPSILERFRQTFTDPVTNEPYASIYFLCCNIGNHLQWAVDYCEYIQMFTFDADLLARMVRDIAEYYLTRSKRLLREDPPNNLAAYHRLNWAYELYQRYIHMGHFVPPEGLNEVNQLRQDLKNEFKFPSNEDN